MKPKCLKKKLDLKKRQILIKLYNEGVKISEIARIIIIDKSTVSRIVKRFLSTGEINTLSKGGSRSAIISNDHKIYIKRYLEENGTLTSKEIKHKLERNF
ncbi:Paired box protein Pax-6 [Dictyocoela muelleri]|nr:Paired box protein Pax-6 [Dictyocoela muelleri]